MAFVAHPKMAPAAASAINATLMSHDTHAWTKSSSLFAFP
jgi:hypothetical protein